MADALKYVACPWTLEIEEAKTDARDVYALVYEAERPELFLKDAACRRTGAARPSARAPASACRGRRRTRPRAR